MNIKKKILAFVSFGTLAVFGLLIATPATATPSNVVYWETTNTSEPTAGTVNWPQTFHSFGTTSSLHTAEPVTALKCGVWYQVDKYTGNHPFGTSVFTLTANGTPGGDQDWIHSWKFVYGGDCEPEPEYGQGEEVEAVAECTGPGIATITTTARSWTSIDGERTYDDPVTYTEQVEDASCVDDEDNPAPPATPVPATPEFTG